MLRIVYNFLQITLLIGLSPLLVAVVLGRRKYRQRIRQRLGFGLRQRTDQLDKPPGTSRIWIHCLSVGEVTSALPLIRALRRRMPATQLILSVTTATGLRLAEDRLSAWTDLVIAAPLDLLPVVSWFIRKIDPDLFIQVETDFWPNWLSGLRSKGIPAMLVNGRISAASFARYKRFNRIFTPLFSSFALLAMQTENDAAQMRALQVPADRLLTLGNLKYAPAEIPSPGVGPLQKVDLNLPPESEVWVCGSTHPGEEEIILSSFASLAADRPDLILLLAPRDPNRTGDIARLARQWGLDTMRRTCPADPPARILLLDTLGELAGCYPLARVAFIGGSLVPCGGHNPLEAAVCGVPVLFGPHMEDFQEIVRDLVQYGGAMTVHSADDLTTAVQRIVHDQQTYRSMSTGAAGLVARNTDVVHRYVEKVAQLLDNAGT